MLRLYMEKSILIDTELETAYSIISDLRKWYDWSPWFIAERMVDAWFATDGRSSKWLGSIVGKGTMAITRANRVNSVEVKISFSNPFKPKVLTRIDLIPLEKEIEMRWMIKSRLPFYLFWKKKKVEYSMGMDYQRGMKMLKCLLEYEKVNSKLTFIGIIKHPPLEYIGIKNMCSLEYVTKYMREDFEYLLSEVYSRYSNLVSGVPFSIYHEWKPLKNSVIYTVAIPLRELPEELKTEFGFGKLPEMNVYKIGHKGAYSFIDNAWAVQKMHKKAKKFKPSISYPPMEFYLNSPMNTLRLEFESESALEVCFPAK